MQVGREWLNVLSLGFACGARVGSVPCVREGCDELIRRRDMSAHCAGPCGRRVLECPFRALGCDRSWVPSYPHSTSAAAHAWSLNRRCHSQSPVTYRLAISLMLVTLET